MQTADFPFIQATVLVPISPDPEVAPVNVTGVEYGILAAIECEPQRLKVALGA